MSERDEIVKYFQTRLPAMLDGAVLRGNGRHCRSLLLRQARTSLRKGKTNPNHLPMEILRETLDGIAAAGTTTSATTGTTGTAPEPAPKTLAGAVPVGSRHARIWWDERVLDGLGDVLERLEQPRLVLRFYDVTGLDPEAERWHETFDVDVEIREKGRTVQFWSGDRTYAVDLGYAHADGRFLRLARANPINLPRDGKAEEGAEKGGAGTATSRIRRTEARDRCAAYVAPDAAADEWASARPDDERRDWNAELVIHMLYRAFLREGSRALRRAPALAPRGAETLRTEFLLRRRRRRTAALKKDAAGAPLFLRRIDAAPAAAQRPVLPHPPVAAIKVEEIFSETVERVATERCEESARSARPARHPHVCVAGAEIPAALFAQPVFEAAKHLRESLSGLRDVPAGVAAAELFDATEAKRLAKAGVRVTRMSLTLEGRIRPGARLKVAGKLVHADADGNFRLECTLSGRRTAIPMRAGASISGEARSLISVDWSKRPNNAKMAEA